MRSNVLTVIGLLAAGGLVVVGCGGDDDNNGGTGGRGGASAGQAGKGGGSGAGQGGTSGTGGKGGSSGSGNAGSGGTSAGTAGTGGSSGTGGSTGGTGTGGTSGTLTGGAAGEAGAGGEPSGGQGGEGGAGPSQDVIDRGAYIVRHLALCGGCHTATNGLELGGNPAFRGGGLPAPNLTPDPTGIGDWTDRQIIDALRNGIDDEGRHLDPSMPYWFFHNLSDDDARAIVAFLRSLPPSSGAVGDANPDFATPPSPLSLSDFPDSSLGVSDADYVAAQQGKYLVSSAARCVSCHSTSSGGLPQQSFFAGVAPSNSTSIFAPNITPDATGLSGWTAADIATALQEGTDKSNVALCGSMPSASKGYGGLTDEDAYAIGVYITTIPAAANSAADPSLEPACP